MSSDFVGSYFAMIIDLENIFNNDDSQYAFDYNFVLGDDDTFLNILSLSPVSVKGIVRNDTGIVSLEAEAVYTYESYCDRCADVFSRRVSLPVKHFLVPSLNDEENDIYIVVENVRLNLDELIREDIILAFPTRLLCRKDCKGLCTLCGADLNKAVCSCKKAVDPRLSTLSDLLDD